jgi:hypothetical protein
MVKQTKQDRDRTKGTSASRYIAFPVVFEYGYAHKKDTKGQSLHPKSYPFGKVDKKGLNLSEIG